MLCQPRETSPLPSPPVSLPVSVLSSTRMPTELPDATAARPAPDIHTQAADIDRQASKE